MLRGHKPPGPLKSLVGPFRHNGQLGQCIHSNNGHGSPGQRHILLTSQEILECSQGIFEVGVYVGGSPDTLGNLRKRRTFPGTVRRQLHTSIV